MGHGAEMHQDPQAISVAFPPPHRVFGTRDKRAGDQVSYDIPLIQKIAAEPALKLV